MEAIDDDDDEEAIIVEGKVMLFSESMVSGGNADGEQMRVGGSRIGVFQGRRHNKIGRREREC